tara:strand:- start:449 stop:670 length:222 start_codon:yes stop_codon:yes gene_type:complete
MSEIPPVQTHIRKITVGTPVRKVTGAQAQSLGDLTNVDLSNLSANSIIQYNSATGKFEATTEPDGLVFNAGSF